MDPASPSSQLDSTPIAPSDGNNGTEQSEPTTPSTPASAQPSTSAAVGVHADGKILITFKSVGNAPILKKNKFKISGDSPFSDVILFMRNVLKMKSSDSLFLYCNQAFSPNPDEMVKDLFKSFGSTNGLVINYALVPAYG